MEATDAKQSSWLNVYIGRYKILSCYMSVVKMSNTFDYVLLIYNFKYLEVDHCKNKYHSLCHLSGIRVHTT